MNSEWRNVRLGDVLVESRERVPVENSAVYPVAGVKIAGGGLFWRDMLSGSATKYDTLYRLREGQLVYRKLTAWEGPITVVPPDFDGAYVSSEFPTFTLDRSELLPEFMTLICQLPSLHDDMKALSSGTAERRNRLAPADLLEVEIDLPPIVEQRRIVHAVGVLDRQRAAQGAYLLALRRFRQALWNETWEALFDDGAELLAAEEVADIRIGGTPARSHPEYFADGTIPWLKTGEIRFAEVAVTSESITETALARSSAKVIPANTVVMAMKGQGATRGRVAIIRREMTTNEAVAAFVPRRPLNPRFLFHWFWSQYAVTREAGEGTSQPNLNSEMVRGLDVLYTSPDAQSRAVARLDPVLVTERTVEREQSASERFRTALLDELLSGAVSAPTPGQQPT
jgi:type I restriction enzyme, S subunit